MRKTVDALWRALEVLAVLVLIYYTYTLLQLGSYMLLTTDYAIMLVAAVLVIGIAEYALRIKEKKRAKRRERPAWVKELTAYVKAPMQWVPPMVSRKPTREAEVKQAKGALASDFERMDSLEFERFVLNLLREEGYRADTAPKRGSKMSGYGVDIIARRTGTTIAVMTKLADEGMVQEKDIRLLLNGMRKLRADKSLIVTTSAIATRAKAIVQQKNVEIWDTTMLKAMVRKYMS